ncbi:MAG: hypothetical protein NTV94_06855 [Planctomycetota bacterium]|nr:hypothetical protein [Planctomycetota bacterium]
MPERLHQSRHRGFEATLRFGRGMAFVLVGMLVAGFFGGGCEQKVVRYNSFLTGLQGAEQQFPSGRKLGEYKDPTLVRESELVKEDKDGKNKTLVARSGRHLMIHIYNCVDDGDEDLFVRQVLSTQTRQDFASRGVSLSEGFRYLQQHQADLQALFSQMPAGEYTPGLFMKAQGGGVQRVELDGLAAKGLFWTGFDMVQERGNWKLRWMVGPERYDD